MRPVGQEVTMENVILVDYVELEALANSFEAGSSSGM
jgi:hypothetical protein